MDIYRVLNTKDGFKKGELVILPDGMPDDGVPWAESLDGRHHTYVLGPNKANPDIELIEEKRDRGGEGIGPSKASESQVDGNHYSKLKIQPIEYCFKNNLNVCQSKAIKYITRYNSKGTPLKDLEKAIHCLQLLIELEELRDE
jgi:hypothetical protein